MITTKTGLHSTTHDTPVGTLTLVASDRGLRAVLWPRDHGRIRLTGRPHKNLDHPFLIAAIGQLDEYFACTRMTFDVPLDVEGTRFQLAAWRALRAIPFGTTVSYAQQAAQLGIPTAARALGAANRSNPVSIIVPCHRVIGSDGSLTGFAGGLPVKRFLIDHEVCVLARAGGNPGQLRFSLPLCGEGWGGGQAGSYYRRQPHDHPRDVADSRAWPDQAVR